MCRLYRSETERRGYAVAVAVTFAMLLGACSDLYWDRRETISLSGGDSITANLVTEMTDPWPPHSNNKNIAFNGERMQTAVECYRTYTVTTPADINPSSSDPGGSGSGSGSAAATKCAPKSSAAGGTSAATPAAAPAPVPRP